MHKLRSFLIGIGLGASAGVLLITLFSPVRGREARQNLRTHYQSAMQAAREASARTRQELEADLQQMHDERHTA